MNENLKTESMNENEHILLQVEINMNENSWDDN
jgi:hypothetical protein